MAINTKAQIRFIEFKNKLTTTTKKHQDAFFFFIVKSISIIIVKLWTGGGTRGNELETPKLV